VSVSPAVIAAGGNTTMVAVQVETSTPAPANLTIQGSSGPVTVGTTGTYQVEVAGTTAQAINLRSGTEVLDSRQVTPACATSSGWDAGVTNTCFAKICWAGEKLTVVRDTIINATGDVKNGVPFSITRVKNADGTTLRWEHAEVANRTGLADNWSQTGFTQRYFNCAVGPVDTFGRAMRSCRVQNGDISDWWELFYVNHAANTFHRIPGRLPAFPEGYRLGEEDPRASIVWSSEQGSIRRGSEDGVNPSAFIMLFQPNTPGASPELVMQTFMGPTGGNTIRTPLLEKNSCTN